LLKQQKCIFCRKNNLKIKCQHCWKYLNLKVM